jgi:hypothetical protein
VQTSIDSAAERTGLSCAAQLQKSSSLILNAAKATFSVMDTVSQTPDYDAFGEPAASGRGRVTSSRRARKLTVAVFWSIALLLIAGRIYQHGTIVGPLAHTLEFASR